ncbi:hypothetical protein NLI96_g71 [Meripilus lineatus]|uniref:F-box domain-containing protein n=1 Tax=Meripilus lineatus TaxID=2056292 RepID=A0AAD5VF47_9APHY|nr:hypothetical protein NLI96_g71 [Physisporinus lineatus]
MRVSPLLYDLGIPTLLKGTVTLGTGSEIHSFSLFLSAKSTQARRSHLRRLTINTTPWDLKHHNQNSSARESVAAILKGATHLESLDFPYCQPFFDIEHPSVIQALASITSLRRLHLGRADNTSEAIFELFTEFSSPISELLISRVIDGEWNQMPHIFHRLPRVEELALRFEGDLMSPEYLPRVFPNLKKLSIFNFQVTQKLKESEIDEMLFRRTQSLITWPSFDFVSSPALCLAWYGPTCPVRRVRTRLIKPCAVAAFCRFLQSAKPSILEFTIHLRQDLFDPGPLFHGLSTVAQPEALSVTFKGDEWDDDIHISDAWVGSILKYQ